MVGSAVLLCFLIGFPLGLLASRGKRTAAVVLVICDTLQTFPSFIYLIPVVMLFKVGDLAAIIAIVAYASVPMIRFTNLGLRSVPSETREAAIQSGCTAWQMLRKVELPIAFPQIMLGINQTILMALIMVAITSLIGTKDLGQEILKAKSDLDVGRALVAGICIAFLGIVADRLIKAWSLKRQAQLGIKA
jgi:glycine betaine/proline transport system permease protein